MATRASSKKEPTQKAKPKADQPVEKGAAPQQATDLISAVKKKPQTEARTSLKSAVPPISKAKQPPVNLIPAARVEPVAETPPPKPETVSLIGETRSKRSDPSGAEPKIKSVLPPISKIKPHILTKAPEPVALPVQPVVPEVVPVAAGEPAAPVGDEKIVHIKPPIIVRELAQQIGLKPFQLIHDLMDMNIFAAINHTIEPDVAAAICKKHGYTFEVEKREKGAGVHTRIVVVEEPPAPVHQPKEELKPRAPIITFMGHVDHGKTSLMDSIRKSRVAAGEAGGITQHIGAYSVVYKGQSITFIDTPGHEAFTAMRARGAKVTDVVVLVVAADDGIMPQTNEAINHARAAKVPIIVAINKIDLPSANIDRVKNQLQEKGLTPEDWGGETICVAVSATKGTGIDRLLEMILLQAEIMELKASPTAPARATVIEAQIEPGRGPTTTVIVQLGTL
jgi:translation initiation factor IF-2